MALYSSGNVTGAPWILDGVSPYTIDSPECFVEPEQGAWSVGLVEALAASRKGWYLIGCMNLFHILSYGFIQRAFVAGLLVAVCCAVLGTFLVLRREAMIGHGLAHVTFGGVALALVFEVSPLPVALGVSLLAAWAIVLLKDRAGLGGDTGIGILSSLGMALGILLASLAGNFNADLLSFLFGSILAIEWTEVWVAAGLAVAVLAVLALFYHELIYTTFDRETARTGGLAVERLDIILIALTAVTVVIGMKVVGLLLVAALIVIPAAAGLVQANTFRQAVFGSVLFAVLSTAWGLLLAFYLDWPAAGTIVLLSGLFLGFSIIRGRPW